MIILGIDPGLAVTGYGLVERSQEKLKGLDYGYISTAAADEPSRRLYLIFNSVKRLIEDYRPHALAVEKLFFCKNVRTALKVGEARGTVFTAAAEKEIPVYEYTPLQVKQAVTGYGRAEKKQVQQMVSLLLNLKELPSPDDAADALAVAICHLQSFRWNEMVRPVKE